MPNNTPPITTDMQEWKNVFKPDTSNNAIYENNEWKSGAFIPGNGQIPKFNQVKTLDNYCNEQGAMRKEKPATNSNEEKKIEVFCLLSK